MKQDELRRYARHLVLPEIGQEGQKKLLASSVLVIGAGGLGSAALAYLASAGIGRLGIVEPDRVELSNLQRQVLFEEADIGRYKSEAARDRLEEIAPGGKIEVFTARLDEANAASLIRSFDLIVDATDNFATRFLIADTCYAEKKPLVHAAISGFSALLTTFTPYLGKAHPCYRCFISENPERELTCEQEGIVGPLAGVMGSMQALEAIRQLLSIGRPLSGRLLRMDAADMQFKESRLARDPNCSACGTAQSGLARQKASV